MINGSVYNRFEASIPNKASGSKRHPLREMKRITEQEVDPEKKWIE